MDASEDSRVELTENNRGGKTSDWLVDTHCHLHDREFFAAAVAEEAVAAAAACGVKQMICVGTNGRDSQAAVEFARGHAGVFAAVGAHPEVAKDLGRETELVSEVLRGDRSQIVAIGEVGLDYHYGREEREKQIRLLEEMLELARKFELPLIFHVREAFADFWPVLDNFQGSEVRGVVHSFSDNKRNLREALERGLYVGVNGVATFATLPTPPLERMLLETDAPFLTPVPNRGKVNESKYIVEIARWVANKLGVTEAEVAAATTKNARELFGISDTVVCPERGL